MKNDLSDITIVLDRSGSMAACLDDAQNGVNHFIDEQKKHEGDAVLSLVQFDTDYEFVHKGVPVKDVPKFVLNPRGMTALLDAVGKAINETGERLSKLDENDRPGLVVFVIVTDGQENSSKEFTTQQVKEMIERQRSDYKWQFTFLGANQDAFAEAGGIGIPTDCAADVDNVKEAFTSGSLNVRRMRTAAASGQSVKCFYTDKERKLMASRS